MYFVDSYARYTYTHTHITSGKSCLKVTMLRKTCFRISFRTATGKGFGRDAKSFNCSFECCGVSGGEPCVCVCVVESRTRFANPLWMINQTGSNGLTILYYIIILIINICACPSQQLENGTFKAVITRTKKMVQETLLYRSVGRDTRYTSELFLKLLLTSLEVVSVTP